MVDGPQAFFDARGRLQLWSQWSQVPGNLDGAEQDLLGKVSSCCTIWKQKLKYVNICKYYWHILKQFTCTNYTRIWVIGTPSEQTGTGRKPDNISLIWQLGSCKSQTSLTKNVGLHDSIWAEWNDTMVAVNLSVLEAAIHVTSCNMCQHRRWGYKDVTSSKNDICSCANTLTTQELKDSRRCCYTTVSN